MTLRAHRVGKALGLAVRNQGGAGPYPTLAYPGSSRRPQGDPAHRPLEVVRSGTATLLTLFHPAVIRGTRTPVRTTVARHCMFGGDLEGVLRSFAHLTDLQVRAALAYHDEHRADMDADNDRHARTLEALAARAVR